MADEIQPTSSRPQFCSEATWSPPSCGWQPSVLYNQHFGLPPLLDSRDLSWMENLFRKLGSSSWSGYTRTSRAVMSMKVHRELSEGVSEVYVEESKWMVSLDVNHFAPTELAVRMQTGFLVIEGKHEERKDEHGYISRSFLRKYKLPLGIVPESIQSCLSGDGILTIEAKITSVPLPADITIPVQVEVPSLEDKQEDGLQREGLAEGDEIPVAEGDASQPPVPAGPEEKPEDESVSQQIHYDERLHPSAPTVEGEQEPIPSRAAEDQQEAISEEQTELLQKKEEDLPTEEVSEEKVEDAGEAAQEVQELAEQLEVTQVPDAVTASPQLEDQVEAVPEGEIQEPEADREQPTTGQTQEEILAQVEVQPQVMLEEQLQAKLGDQ
ncbi:uncharacterized protein [Salminus brasiliensis]|uniref:uncharacterized protein n=1 Tax=Salminus brasiliensis TaxID=930266 RepID=UPI003B83043D